MAAFYDLPRYQKVLAVLYVNFFIDADLWLMRPVVPSDNRQICRNAYQRGDFLTGHFLFHPVGRAKLPAIHKDVQVPIFLAFSTHGQVPPCTAFEL
jgi:hypothetical protein